MRVDVQQQRHAVGSAEKAGVVQTVDRAYSSIYLLPLHCRNGAFMYVGGVEFKELCVHVEGSLAQTVVLGHTVRLQIAWYLESIASRFRGIGLAVGNCRAQEEFDWRCRSFQRAMSSTSPKIGRSVSCYGPAGTVIQMDTKHPALVQATYIEGLHNATLTSQCAQ